MFFKKFYKFFISNFIYVDEKIIINDDVDIFFLIECFNFYDVFFFI